MATIQWRDSYSVGDDRMDSQHKRLVVMLNNFNDSLSKGHGKEKLYDTLMGLVDYTKKHFKDEEALMESINYPGLEDHKREHKELTRQVVDFAKKYNAGETAITIELMHFLRDWLINHIQGEDKRYGEHLKRG
jgi:hemerythrin-like metal-binding protein